MKAPEFWQHPAAWPGRLLMPAGACYALAGWLRWRFATPLTVPVPVICIGNLTAGGTGKTPVALAVAEVLAHAGRRPHFLSRGYGGRLHGPVQVDPDHHGADDVGDEPLLLARVAPTWISRHRAAGAQAAAAAGADVIVMDDGFQNPSLTKALSLVVIDAAVGFGNGRLIPAGPLREPVDRGLSRADAIVLVGSGDPDNPPFQGGAASRPVLRARLVVGRGAAAWHGRRVLAFAGIGRPAKFYATLEQIGAVVVDHRAFPDHHRYRTDEIAAVIARAAALDATAVTTTKDAMRLPPDARQKIDVLPVHLAWDDPSALQRLLAPILALPTLTGMRHHGP